MKKITLPWVRKAEADRRGAEQLARTDRPLHNLVCFHWQQCAEKYLKALFAETGLSIPKTHDLDRLLALLTPRFPELETHRRGLLQLSTFAVETRYPGVNTTKRHAESAARVGGRVRLEVRRILGLRELA